MKTTILALAPLLSAEMDVLEQKYNVLKLWESPDPDAILRQHSNDIQAVVSTFNSGGASERLMQSLPNLEIIAQYGVGYDNIDLTAAKERNIVVTNTPDVVTDDTADMAVFLALAVARRAVEADMFVRVGRWQASVPTFGVSLSGKTVGVVGMGKIGQAIANRLAPFNTHIVYHGRTKKDVPFEYYDDLASCAKASDFLILACAGGAETHHLIDYEILEALGPKGYLINIARGSVVNQEDLLMALHNKKIAGAGLDVFDNEPHVPEEMLKMDNVVLSPHVGGGTFETRSAMGQLVINNLDAYFEGKDLLTPIKMAS